MAAQDDIDGSPPVRRRRLADIGADALTNVVSDNTSADFFSGARIAACDEGVMRIILDRSETMKAVLGRPYVMEKLQELWGSQEELSEKCAITPLDATPLPTRIFSHPQVGDHVRFITKFHFSQPAKIFDDPTARQAWVGANGDWLAFLLHNGGVQWDNLYTGITVDVPRFTSIGLRHVDSNWEYSGRTFNYDLISPKLKKIAIAHPPTRYCGFEDYDLIVVLDNRIAITGRCGVTHSLTWYMLATPHLTPSRYEDAVYSGGRYFAVMNNGTC